MRYVFGLVGILVTLAIIIVFMSEYQLPAVRQGLQAKKGLEEQFSMSTSGGLADAKASITLDPVNKGSQFHGLLVQAIAPGGPMGATFGLAPGDVIVGTSALRFQGVADPDLATDMIFEAKTRKQSLIVLRPTNPGTPDSPTNELQLPPR
jgi:hypothetical protein